MSVTDETLALLAQQKRAIIARLGATSDALVVAWARTWDELAAELSDAIEALSAARPSSIERARRARAALAIASSELDKLTRRGGVRITDDALALIRAALADQPELVASQLPDGIGLRWNRPDARQMSAMAQRTTQTIHKRTKALSAEAEQAMKRELMRGVGLGNNPQRTAARMLNRVQGVFNGGLARTLVIARTETLDAYRTAAQQAQKANSDVVTGWVWLATLSNRTCPSCIAQHGSKHKLAEPGPLDHHQGRCTRMPLTKTWADLGLDIPEPPPAIPDARRWFDRLPEAEKRKILGPARYDAYRAGRFPISDWSVRRSTPGWRDSMHTAPAPRSRALAS